MWTPSDYLQNAVKTRNYIQIYNELCSIIHKDPTFATYELTQAIHYIQGQGVPALIHEHDGRPFAEREQWDKEYWALVISDLMDNFSILRLEHMKEVGRQLFGKPQAAHTAAPRMEAGGVPRPVSRPSPRPSPRPYMNASSGRPSFGRPAGKVRRSGDNNAKKLGAVAIIAGLAVAGAAALGFKKGLLVGGAAALIGGTIYLLRKSR
ncbi:hypothetical protein [Paenibacillus spongiae]|uniref:Uncharacterized protein n=1 Tax=Paenibacillus spongiae TaxID=2909671 RepID=A0ABY5SI85_9BACL|nr:hypothetical protein [Paenibacillus spongiae]UVI31963.1 hypothetical protein L1F29_09165 [Paenibacillus spongiae]